MLDGATDGVARAELDHRILAIEALLGGFLDTPGQKTIAASETEMPKICGGQVSLKEEFDVHWSLLRGLQGRVAALVKTCAENGEMNAQWEKLHMEQACSLLSLKERIDDIVKDRDSCSRNDTSVFHTAISDSVQA